MKCEGSESGSGGAPDTAVARMTEKSKGKDTTIGHWEIAGLISENPLPTYPNGFPQEVLDEFTRLTGRGVLCNKPYSGTELSRITVMSMLRPVAYRLYISRQCIPDRGT